MQKIVNAWTKNPTLANANNVYRHAKKHPMSIFTLDAAGHASVAAAVRLIRES